MNSSEATESSSSAELLIKELQSYEKYPIPHELTKEINLIISKAREDMTRKAAKFLHTQIDDEKHTEDEVKAVVDTFPSALSYEDSIGTLPVQRAACQNDDGRIAVSFIPVLAKHGERLKVGGEGTRGGLLCELPSSEDGENVLQLLSFSVDQQTQNVDEKDTAPVLEKMNADIQFDVKRAEVIRKLRDLDLLIKEDILEYHLLQFSSYQKCEQRFRFFVNWCPDALQKTEIRGEPLLHTAIRHMDPIECFEMVLKISMEHFPDQVGFLYQKFKGKSALEASIEKIGEHETMSIIRRCIPRAPKLMQSVATCSPDASYLRDANNRTLFQSELSSGFKTFASKSSFFLQASDKQVKEKDPLTGLFPFMLAASRNTSDLSGVYCLLKRNPGLTRSGIHDRKRKISYMGRQERRIRSQGYKMPNVHRAF